MWGPLCGGDVSHKVPGMRKRGDGCLAGLLLHWWVTSAWAGSCTSDDVTIWSGSGQSAFRIDSAVCGNQCFLSSECYKDCVLDRWAYSSSCIDVFGAHHACIISDCVFANDGPCIAGQEAPGCFECVASRCDPVFMANSGLSIGARSPAAPPAPAQAPFLPAVAMPDGPMVCVDANPGFDGALLAKYVNGLPAEFTGEPTRAESCEGLALWVTWLARPEDIICTVATVGELAAALPAWTPSWSSDTLLHKICARTCEQRGYGTCDEDTCFDADIRGGFGSYVPWSTSAERAGLNISELPVNNTYPLYHPLFSPSSEAACHGLKHFITHGGIYFGSIYPAPNTFFLAGWCQLTLDGLEELCRNVHGAEGCHVHSLSPSPYPGTARWSDVCPSTCGAIGVGRCSRPCADGEMGMSPQVLAALPPLTDADQQSIGAAETTECTRVLLWFGTSAFLSRYFFPPELLSPSVWSSSAGGRSKALGFACEMPLVDLSRVIRAELSLEWSPPPSQERQLIAAVCAATCRERGVRPDGGPVVQQCASQPADTSGGYEISIAYLSEAKDGGADIATIVIIVCGTVAGGLVLLLVVVLYRRRQKQKAGKVVKAKDVTFTTSTLSVATSSEQAHGDDHAGERNDAENQEGSDQSAQRPPVRKISTGFGFERRKKNAMETQIFISLRFGEAMEEAVQLRDALKAMGYKVFLCDEAPGINLQDIIFTALENAMLVVILGSKTYGKKTDSTFSTHEELNLIMVDNIPYFLIKMCERFEEVNARAHLGATMYLQWMPGTEMPEDLPKEIEKKFKEEQKSQRESPRTRVSRRSFGQNQQETSQGERRTDQPHSPRRRENESSSPP